MKPAESLTEAGPGVRRSVWGGRLLLLTALLTTLGLARLAYPVWRQRQLVHQLKADGFSISAAPAFPVDKPAWLGTLSQSIAWSAVSVRSDRDHLGTDKQIERIRELFDLTYQGWKDSPGCSLSLNQSVLTDTGLARLENARNVTQLRLSSSKITPRGVVSYLQSRADADKMWIGRSASLRPDEVWIEAGPHDVCVSASIACDEYLEGVTGLPRLVRLTIEMPGISDAGIAHLRDLPALKHLSLRGTSITSASLDTLTRLPSLISLELDNTGITDHGFEAILRCPQLARLSLRSTAISDASLPVLKQLVPRCDLVLYATAITPVGLATLKAVKQQTRSKFLIDK